MSSEIWIMSEIFRDEVTGFSYQLVEEAKQLANKLKAEVSVVLIGSEVMAKNFSPFGVARVYAVEDGPLGKTLDARVEALADLVREHKPSLILFGESFTSHYLAARLARKLGTGLATKCVEVYVDEEGKLVARRSIYRGKAHITVGWTREPAVLTFDLKSLQ